MRVEMRLDNEILIVAETEFEKDFLTNMRNATLSVDVGENSRVPFLIINKKKCYNKVEKS